MTNSPSGTSPAKASCRAAAPESNSQLRSPAVVAHQADQRPHHGEGADLHPPDHQRQQADRSFEAVHGHDLGVCHAGRPADLHVLQRDGELGEEIELRLAAQRHVAARPGGDLLADPRLQGFAGKQHDDQHEERRGRQEALPPEPMRCASCRGFLPRAGPAIEVARGEGKGGPLGGMPGLWQSLIPVERARNDDGRRTALDTRSATACAALPVTEFRAEAGAARRAPARRSRRAACLVDRGSRRLLGSRLGFLRGHRREGRAPARRGRRHARGALLPGCAAELCREPPEGASAPARRSSSAARTRWSGGSAGTSSARSCRACSRRCGKRASSPATAWRR